MSFNTDSTITLSLLKRFRRLAQAATRIACVLGVTGALLLSSASYAVAPIQMNIKLQQSPKMYAKATLNKSEYKCALELYTKESNWRPNAKNGHHYGIPQGKSEYLKTANKYEQVDWGLAYIEHRYGTPCAALRFFRENNYH